MINPHLDHDKLAEQIAEECICEHCQKSALEAIENHICTDLYNKLYGFIQQIVRKHKKQDGQISQEEQERQAEREKKIAERKEFFDALFKRLNPHEKKFTSMLRAVWKEEEAVIVANLKKLKKAWLAKGDEDIVDSLLYPKRAAEKKLEQDATEIIVVVMQEQGSVEMERLGANVAFDVENPEVQKWLESYVMKFTKEMEKVSQDKLKKILMEKLREGASIPEMIKAIRTEFSQWNKIRAERIARSESIRASNAGSKAAMLQSGVVEKIQWVAFLDKRVCGFCEDMDGKIIGIKESFFDLGDTYTIESEGKKQSMDIDYTPCEYPPLHVDCRCTIAAYFE